MTLGQEFTAWAITVGEDIDRLTEATRLIHETNLGATAIATGVNTGRPQPFSKEPTFTAFTRHLLFGLDLSKEGDLVEVHVGRRVAGALQAAEQHLSALLRLSPRHTMALRLLAVWRGWHMPTFVYRDPRD